MKKKIKVIILRTGGTNCDRETAHACEMAGGAAERVHVNQLIRGERKLGDYQFMVIPGGFSYGDDISAGRILANELRFKLGDELQKFVADGKPVLGICNGFQVLVKTGLLPGLNGKPRKKSQQATLFTNDSARFECRWVFLKRTAVSHCIFTHGLPETITLPVAHGEGKLIFDSEETRSDVLKKGQAVFRYVDSGGNLAGYPHNPNGSEDNIAGICDPTGLVFGLMPHPERHIFPHHHPRWSRGEAPSLPHGLPLFRNAVRYAATEL
ncbi:MAG: phosphoribosylformylglycinamidine synthase I [bacterium]